MADSQLMLKLKLDGEAEWRVKEAARIQVDWSGLTLIEPHTGAVETIPLGCVEIVSIRPLSRDCGAGRAGRSFAGRSA